MVCDICRAALTAREQRVELARGEVSPRGGKCGADGCGADGYATPPSTLSQVWGLGFRVSGLGFMGGRLGTPPSSIPGIYCLLESYAVSGCVGVALSHSL